MSSFHTKPIYPKQQNIGTVLWATVDIWFHFIQWIVKNGYLQLIYCPTNEMVADTLTKALSSPKVKHFARELRFLLIWGGVLESGKQIWPEPSTHHSCLHSKWHSYHCMYHLFYILSYFVATHPFLFLSLSYQAPIVVILYSSFYVLHLLLVYNLTSVLCNSSVYSLYWNIQASHHPLKSSGLNLGILDCIRLLLALVR